MKKILVLALAVLTGAGVLQAQEKRDTIRPRQTAPGQQKHGGKQKGLEAELGLSKEQSQQWKTLNQEFRKQHQAVNADSTLSVPQKKEKSRELYQERQKKINGMLSADQQVKYRKYQQELRKKVQGIKKADIMEKDKDSTK
ncbi:MAG: hypothetical protein P0Y53_11075 [Candidatus Pseudobacter hemicellulosilyticus]|uniref:DUF4890 domain-containing protein n=1 Tax=Candidatus Pseudobacter hemicellulosilyticus TaxID=3121375 RepID=A0AAJ5WYR4_9BACT|nr:MAG: hypothetical protein P0Y53_11075 [Pseudobacter sp.]